MVSGGGASAIGTATSCSPSRDKALNATTVRMLTARRAATSCAHLDYHLKQSIELGCGYPYTANAGNARSYGPELEISARLTPEFTVNHTAT
jgi:hypothetical protein